MDPSRLISVFANLIENAIQHSSRSATVNIEAAIHECDHRIWARCTVSDTGPGIREEDLARLFEPFFSRRQGGTGLGLAIVHRIVQEHSGNIVLRNRPSCGAQVVVWLPTADRAAISSA